MTIAFRAEAHAYIQNNTTLTINKPSGTVDGDLMVAVFHAYDGGAGNVFTPPAGWSLIRRINNGGVLSSATYWKIASAEGASYTWTDSVSEYSHIGAIVSYSGDFPVNPLDAEGGNTYNVDDTSYPANSITTTRQNTLLIFACSHGGTDIASISPPSGMTERVDYYAGALTYTIAYISDQMIAAAGGTGSKTATGSDNANNKTLFLAAFYESVSTSTGMFQFF